MDRTLLRTCRTCGVEKSVDDYYTTTNNRRGKTYLFLDCKICHCDKNKARRKVNPTPYRAIEQRSQKLRAYGLTLEAWQDLFDKQGGLCAICRGDNDGRTLHVDHCHTTGAVRGLLCSRCNRGIGNFHDDPDRLMVAAYYLKGGES